MSDKEQFLRADIAALERMIEEIGDDEFMGVDQYRQRLERQREKLRQLTPSMDTPQRTVMEAMQGYRVADAMRKLASITEQCVADGTYGDADTPAVVEN